LGEGLACFLAARGEDSSKAYAFELYYIRETRKVIRENRALPLERLCALSPQAFHIDDEARNYTQSVCLLYYLEERGALAEFCGAFCRNRRKDSTGYNALKRAVGHEDADDLRKAFESFVFA
jgi:hypothetical protein